MRYSLPDGCTLPAQANNLNDVCLEQHEGMAGSPYSEAGIPPGCQPE